MTMSSSRSCSSSRSQAASLADPGRPSLAGEMERMALPSRGLEGLMLGGSALWED